MHTSMRDSVSVLVSAGDVHVCVYKHASECVCVCVCVFVCVCNFDLKTVTT